MRAAGRKAQTGHAAQWDERLRAVGDELRAVFSDHGRTNSATALRASRGTPAPFQAPPALFSGGHAPPSTRKAPPACAQAWLSRLQCAFCPPAAEGIGPQAVLLTGRGDQRLLQQAAAKDGHVLVGGVVSLSFWPLVLFTGLCQNSIWRTSFASKPIQPWVSERRAHVTPANS